MTAYPITFQNCEAWSNLSTPTILSIPAKLAWLPLGAAAGGITFLIEKLVRK